MKVKKKTAMIASFTLGALLLATTALADIATKSGYDQFKDALKLTAAQCSGEFDSFTMDFSIEMKDNGKLLASNGEITKYDRKKNASETEQTGVELNGEKRSQQSYSDNSTIISYSDNDKIYHVTEFTKPRNDQRFSDPFKEDRAEDFEKIVDAVVGGLKDHVVVTDNQDGTKSISGSLTEVQIPSLVNAVASFQMKQEFGTSRDSVPHLTKDVFVKEVTGTAKLDKDGVMENILGTVVLSGKDDKGTSHDITIEALAKLSGINSTTVTKPDLTGKTVDKNTADPSGNEITNPEKFIGKYKNNILLEKDNKYIKVGERVIEITQIDNKTATGHYYEVYKSGYEQYADPKHDFTIKAQKSEEKNSSGYDYTTDSGSKGNLYFDEHEGKIYLNGNSPSQSGLIFDSTFSLDLE